MTVCDFCQKEPARGRGRFCSKRCRQAAFRVRLRRMTSAPADRPMRVLYADPPYVGLSKKYYGRESSFAGEVDHAALIAEILAGGFDGWALSASMKSLREILPLCPAQARVCPWVKPVGVPPATHGLHNAWEPLIVVGGRQERPGRRDWLRAQPARGWGELPGRKPLAFWAFLFSALGMRPGDTFVDRFPGTGMGSRTWAELSRTPGEDRPRVEEYSSDPAPEPRRSSTARRRRPDHANQLSLLRASPGDGETLPEVVHG